MIARFDGRRPQRFWLGMALVLMVGCTTLTNPAGQANPASQPVVPATAPSVVGDGVSPGTIPQAREAVATSDAQAKLDRRLPEVKFDGMGLSDVIDFLRDTSGANIFVNWKALEAGGIDKNAPITARLMGVKLSKALHVILDSVSTAQTKLGFVLDDGVITITTGDELNTNVITRVYDIRDLIEPAQDYKAPTFGSSAAPATQPAASEDKRPTREQLTANVVNLIKEAIAADSWDKIGRIKELSGQLVITQTPENHEQIAKLLGQLRETHGIQVMIESHFIVVDKATALNFGLEPATVSDEPTSRPSAGVYLSREKVAALLNEAQHSKKVHLLAAPRIGCFNSQQAYMFIGTSVAYASGWNMVKDNQGKTTWEPLRGQADTGLALELRPTVSADRKYATLSIHPTLSWLDRMDSEPFPNSPPGEKLFIQRPVMTTRELHTTVNIRDGETLVLNGFAERGDKAATQPDQPVSPSQPNQALDEFLKDLGPDRLLFLLIKPTIIIPRQGEQKPFPNVQTRPAP